MIRQFSVVRFLLMLMIFLHHEDVYQGGGCLAVSGFFILSGICMTLGYGSKVGRSDFSYMAYVTKRIAKFFPLHWICLLAVLIPTWYYGKIYNNHALLANFLLLQSWVPIEEFYFSFNALSWYLSDAVFLSLAFPVLYVFLSNIGKKERVFVLVLLVCLYALMMLALPSNYQVRQFVLYIHPVSRAIDFVIGIFIAELYKELKEKESVKLFVKDHGFLVDVVVVASLLASIGISVLLPTNLFAVFYWPLLSCFFLAVMLMGDTKMYSFMCHETTQWLTRSVFSFFLVHQIVIGWVRWMNDNLIGIERWAEIIVAFVACYLLSQVLYILIEKNFTQWLLKRL